MSELMHDLEFIGVYLDDILCITLGNWDTHLEQLEKVLTHLEAAGSNINANKSSFSQMELEYLSFWIDHESIQPLSWKVEAIQNIKAPQNRKHLHQFIGIVNF